jgi:SRSO17 transposase
MKRRELKCWEERLEAFLEELTAAMGRPKRRRWAGVYVRGLLLDGQRKSVEPMARRVLGAPPLSPPVQALQLFVSQSTWACEEVLWRLARRWEARQPEAETGRIWIVDETSFPKSGSHSVGVQRQYCGALGKTANCQVAVSVNVAREDGALSQPLNWRLYLPRSWVEDPARCQKAGVPQPVAFKTKPQLALDLIDESLGWGLARPQSILSDEVYGGSFDWRVALRKRQLGYAVQVGNDALAWLKEPEYAVPLQTSRRGGSPFQCPRLVSSEQPQTLAALAAGLAQESWQSVVWREGSKGPMQSRFARLTVWAAHNWSTAPTPQYYVPETLLIEWPEGEPAPTKYWLLWSPSSEGDSGVDSAAGPSLAEQVAQAKGRWRIEQDYRELKDELGLDHFEGRSYGGWHHHATLCTMAFAFLREVQAHLAAEEASSPSKSKKKPTRSAGSSHSAASSSASAGLPHPALRPVPVVSDPI